MHPVIAALARHAALRPSQPALSDGKRPIDYATLHRLVSDVAAALACRRPAAVAIAVDNTPAWLVLDLACLSARIPCVPVPGFFSPTQQVHLIGDAEVELLITDRPDFYTGLPGGQVADGSAVECEIAGTRLARFRLQRAQAGCLPRGTAKVTYTSGTTGAPKGVCLDGDALSRVARSLAAACGLRFDDRHVSLLPLSTLLENVAVYAALLAGATCCVPSLTEIGLPVAAGFDCERMVRQLALHRATTAITTPQMAHGAIDVLETGAVRLDSARFLAVGGAVVPTLLLDRAAALGLPLYQGYGLTECSSVVALNTPQHNRPGSVGRPLPHASVSIAEDGEVLVKGAVPLGYCGSDTAIPALWPTGDIGHMKDGYLHITGRRKNIFITSFGRNVAPEWVEGELACMPAIRQAWVYGEGRPWNTAVITPSPGTSRAQIDAAVECVNARLPAYARVSAWLESKQPFSCANGELTANGRLRRDALLAHYARPIERLYKETIEDVL